MAVFHTFFGIAGLSLIGILHEEGGIDGLSDVSGYRMIDPVYALPTDVVQKLDLKAQIIVSGKNALMDDRLKQYDIYRKD